MRPGSWEVCLKRIWQRLDSNSPVESKLSVSTQVLNIHRGLLNVFQLSIKQSQNVYELQEVRGAQGVCKTQYAITEEEAERYRLTKSRDLNHCQERVMRDIGLAYTKTCLNLPTVFVLILRAVKADNKPLGYEIAGYMDRDHNRVQVIIAAQAPEDNWRLVADAIKLSKHKVAAKIAWGDKALKYDTTITAETGLVKDKMAARVRVAWKRLPSSIVKNVTIAHLRKSSKGINIYISSVRLPMTLPINGLKEMMPFEDTLDNAHYILAKASSSKAYIIYYEYKCNYLILNVMLCHICPAVCKFDQEHITTFNDRRYKNFMPTSCYQVLVQECSDRPEFLVLLKKESEHSYAISVKIGTEYV
uniref:VWFD domain-containing protein n=1 Tax=Neogobius melanostomus TaxID=47308 RepID=A0A8C6WFF1_9GOBI